MSKHFYETIPDLSPKILFELDAKNKCLEDFILMILDPKKEYSPYDVLELCQFYEYKTKENSVRRALTDLRKERGEIEFTGNKIVNTKYSNVPNQTIRLKKLIVKN
jgi:hypothetical protein